MDDAAFEEVYRTHFAPVYRYLLSLTRDPRLAEELTQETFFRALRSVDRFRGDSGLLTWLFAIARNAFLTEARRRPTAPLEEAASLSDGGESPEERLIRLEEGERWMNAVEALEEPYREVFRLRLWGEKPFREIGAAFGKSENWACVVYHRAADKLRKRGKDGSL